MIRNMNAHTNATKRYLVLQEKSNPSTDYFVLPCLQKMVPDGVPIITISWGSPLDLALLDNACVVLVRYVPSNWRAILTSHRSRLQSLVYFMDDDIPDWRASRGLSLKYRFKLYRHGQRHFGWLKQQNADFWVSTKYLASKYHALNCQQVEPTQLGLPNPQPRCRVFYHATASHRDEIAWLHPVMKAVLAQTPHIDFEIVGDSTTLDLFRGLPRTTVVHPMSWAAYQAFVTQPGRDIGLAPFLTSPFNAARSHTKLFDIQRAGAYALLANNGPWQALSLDFSTSALIPMDQGAWIKAIIDQSQVVITNKYALQAKLLCR